MILTQPSGTHNSYDLDGNQTSTDSTATGSTAQRQTSWGNGDEAATFTVGTGPALGNTYLANTNTERFTTATSATTTDTLLISPLGISGFDETIALAEADAVDYAAVIQDDPNAYLGLAQCYELADEIGSGAEVFSLMRASHLGPTDYLNAVFDTGGERQQTDGS